VRFLLYLFASDAFQPHGYCYQWNTGLVWLNVISDSVIALAYFTIPITLVSLIRKRRDLPFGWMFGLFATFIIACGSTHAAEVWNLWHAHYWLAGALKGITAAASLTAAVLLNRLTPQALALPGSEQWSATNLVLQDEIKDRKALEAQLRINEAMYRDTAALMDLTHDAIFVRNGDDHIVFWNAAAEKLYGWQRDEVYGKTSHELLHTVFPRPLEEIEQEILGSGYWEGELIHTCRNGSTVTVSSRWALNEVDGQAPKVLESNRDISRRKQEEEKVRGLLDAAPDSVVIANHQGVIVLVNSRTEIVFGYPRQELLLEKVEVILPGYGQNHAQDRPARGPNGSLPKHKPTSVELNGRRKNGSEFPAEITSSPFETADEILISISIRDITERKHAEELMRLSEERFRILVQSVKDYALLMLDPHGCITTWNDSAQQILGYRSEEMLGQSFSGVYTPDDIEKDKPAKELKIAEERQRFEREGQRARKDGSLFWASTIIVALRDGNNHLRGFGVVIRDITARKRTDEELESRRREIFQRNAQLVVANNELESFSYSVSHDLRTPLRAIDGFSHALLEDYGAKLDEQGREYLGRIRSATQRMGSLIDDLLNLSRLSRTNMQTQQVDLTAVVNAVVTEIRKVQPQRQVDFQAHEGLSTIGDPGLLRVVFENLLGNAWKFTSKKSSPVHIEVGQCNGTHSNAFFVRDDGAGFDPAYATRLFGAFQRLHGQQEFEGTGVGLATVQRIIQRHGGRIWAESALGQGATFYFTLNEESAKESNQ
jgi:PAS domain S-box-containing protein